jgi:glycosyltransferase involved in cell wall biosynthesis
MRVTHVHRISGIGGSERHLLALLPALCEHGVEPSFVGLDDPRGQPEPFYAELGRNGVPFARVRSDHDVDPRLPLWIARAARAFAPHLLHTHLVSTKHNDDPFRSGPFRHVERLIARRARRVIAITESLARFNRERVGIPGAKLVVVHYGIDGVPPAWDANPPLELPDGARVLLALSRLVPQKGLDIAVRALPSSPPRGPGVRPSSDSRRSSESPTQSSCLAARGMSPRCSTAPSCSSTPRAGRASVSCCWRRCSPQSPLSRRR